MRSGNQLKVLKKKVGFPSQEWYILSWGQEKQHQSPEKLRIESNVIYVVCSDSWSGRYNGYLYSETPYVGLILIGLAARMCQKFCACAVYNYHHQHWLTFFQRIRPNIMRKWPKWNKITQQIWLWMYQEQFVILSLASLASPVSNQSAMSSSFGKQCTCIELLDT